AFGLGRIDVDHAGLLDRVDADPPLFGRFAVFNDSYSALHRGNLSPSYDSCAVPICRRIVQDVSCCASLLCKEKAMRSRMIAVVAGLVVMGASAPCQAQSLNGSGSSFVGPMLSKWARDYKKAKEVEINYTTVGSGKGIAQLLSQDTDFACTDAPMTDEQLQKARTAAGDVIHIPLVLGGGGPAYNLGHIKQPLRLTGPVLADIFMGKITHWNDPGIKELNAGVDLPDKKIAVLHRDDSSGSTAIFTDYLAKVSKDWKDKLGAGTQIKWPVGEGHKGNEDLAAAITRTPGAIGYVDLIHALQKKLRHPKIKNADGNFVQ